MTMYLDPRSGSNQLYGPLPRAETELARLPSADLMFTGYDHTGIVLVGIEYKKLGDSLQCMQDGRLVAQLIKMIDDYDRRYLLIEADIRPDPRTGVLQKRLRKQQRGGKWSEFWVDVLFGAREKVTYQGYMAWLWTVTRKTGTELLRTTSEDETAALITTWHRQYQKAWDSHGSTNVFDDSHPPRFIVPTEQMRVARDLADGMGWEKGIAAAEHFGSIRAMVNATASEWRCVPGVDKVLAARVVATIDKQHATVTTGPRKRVADAKTARKPAKRPAASAASAASATTGVQRAGSTQHRSRRGSSGGSRGTAAMGAARLPSRQRAGSGSRVRRLSDVPDGNRPTRR